MGGTRVLAWWVAVIVAGGCGGDDAPAIDASPPIDAGVDALVLEPVQCRSSDDCEPLTQSGCFAARPGGVCTDCGDQGDNCPPDTVCIAGGTSGSNECAYRCEDDGDCNIGMYCVPDGPIAGHCQPRLCGDGHPPCPYPYTFCRETAAPLFECARPMCADGCPPPLVCPTDGAFCVEP